MLKLERNLTINQVIKLLASLKIFIGLILGILVGSLLGEKATIFQPLGSMFINLVSMLVVPIVFVSLLNGIVSMKDPIKMGRVTIKTMVIYLVSMATSTAISLFLCLYVFSPGKSLELKTKQSSNFIPASSSSLNLEETLINIVPNNIFISGMEGNILQIIFLSILFGIAISASGSSSKPLIQFFESLSVVLNKLITMVMKTAPIGVFALIAVVAGTQGVEVFSSLLGVVLIIYFCMFFVMFIGYGTTLALFCRLNPVPFFKKMFEVQSIAFTTTSSMASLPANIEVAHKKIGIEKSFASYILPLGATINMNGLSVYIGVVVIFAINVFNLQLSNFELIQVTLMSTLASMGCAGVPAAGLIVIPLVLNSIGVPIEVIGMIAAVDRIVDMVSTATNITGDTFTAVVVADMEGELNRNIYNS